VADWAWLIPVLPAVSAVLILAFGKRMRRGGSEIGIVAVGLALLVSIGGAVEGCSANGATATAIGPAAEGASAGEATAFLLERSVQLTPFGEGVGFDVGMRIDGLAAMMFLLVTFVSLMVQIYSTGYMHGDPRFTWFFTVLSLFTAAMLLLVIADNLLIVLVGWELVGVCSFLLIGFWWEKKPNQDAAIKAFLTTKFGDIGLMVGVITLYGMFRTPRTVKRFVNTYRLFRARLNEAELRPYLGEDGHPQQFPCAMVLLAIIAGFPTLAARALTKLSSQRPNVSWEDLVQTLAKDVPREDDVPFEELRGVEPAFGRSLQHTVHVEELVLKGR
jgi:NADH:ubiquinone oxidoreductase subunit 5 (subunit L)/multisubunit Na+/H+ antiporter MnhA subunit